MPGSVQGISQARTLEWVAISFSRGASQPGDQTRGSCIGMGSILSVLVGDAVISRTVISPMMTSYNISEVGSVRFKTSRTL